MDILSPQLQYDQFQDLRSTLFQSKTMEDSFAFTGGTDTVECRQTGDWAGENIGFMFMVTLVCKDYLSQ